jgi:hypothetical protein
VDKDTGQILQSGMEMEDVLRATLDDLHEYETTLKLDKSLKPEEAIAEKKKADAEEEEEEEQAFSHTLAIVIMHVIEYNCFDSVAGFDYCDTSNNCG